MFVRLAMTATAASVCLIAAAGCIDRNYTSLDEFIVRQKEWEEAEKSRVTAQKPSTPVDQVLTGYRLGPNDVLEVTLTGLEAPLGSNNYRVRVDKGGQIDLPMVGAVKVGDLELSDAEIGRASCRERV